MYDLPAEELIAQCPLFLKHIQFNICGDCPDLINVTFDWIRHLWVNPSVKSGVALVLSGLPGVGKTAFFEALMRITGKHHSHVTHDAFALGGTFSHAQAPDLRLDVYDEAIASDDPRMRGIVNGLITSSKVSHEEKYKSRETYESFSNIIVLSNYVRAVQAIVAERRYQCYDVQFDESECGEKAQFFRDLYRKEIENDRAMAAFFLLMTKHRDTPFTPDRVVKNEALWRNVYYGLSPEDRWWFNCLRFRQLHTDAKPRPQKVTGNPEEPEEERISKYNIWDGNGLGKMVSLRLLRESLSSADRGKKVENAKVIEVVQRGCDDATVFKVGKIGGRGNQEPAIFIPALGTCRTYFATWLQFPPEKIFTEWTTTLK